MEVKNKEMARVAVIILNWNGEKLLREFLPSVVKYTDPGLGRIVVADNASEDDSVRYRKSFNLRRGRGVGSGSI